MARATKPARLIWEAADHILRVDNKQLEAIAAHDPDMFRDVAAAYIAWRGKCKAAVKILGKQND